MTDVLAVLAFAVLFVIMGLVYRHRGCHGAKEGGSCAEGCGSRNASCPLKYPSESKDACS